MKKLIFLAIIVCTAILGSCNNEDNSVSKKTEEQNSSIKSARVDAIVNFKNYLLQNNLIEHPDFINLEKSSTQLIDGVEVINLIEISPNNNKINLYRGIKVSESKKSLIPNYSEYLMIQEQYTDVNVSSMSAKSKKFDLNYGKFKFQEANIIDGIVVSDLLFDLGLGSVTTNGGPLPSDCKGGRDGNLSWGECMNCVKTVCKQDPNCNSTCDAIDTFRNLAFVLVPASGAFVVGCETALGIGCAGAAAVY